MKTIDGFRLRNIMGQAAIIGEGVNQVDFSKLIILNDSAAYLWRCVEGNDFEILTLANLLVDKYGIALSIAEKDAESIAKQWIKVGIVSE